MTSGRVAPVLAVDARGHFELILRVLLVVPVVERLEAERGVGLGVFGCMLSVVVVVPLFFIGGLRGHRQNAIAATTTLQHPVQHDVGITSVPLR